MLMFNSNETQYIVNLSTEIAQSGCKDSNYNLNINTLQTLFLKNHEIWLSDWQKRVILKKEKPNKYNI